MVLVCLPIQMTMTTYLHIEDLILRVLHDADFFCQSQDDLDHTTEGSLQPGTI